MTRFSDDPPQVTFITSHNVYYVNFHIPATGTPRQILLSLESLGGRGPPSAVGRPLYPEVAFGRKERTWSRSRRLRGATWFAVPPRPTVVQFRVFLLSRFTLERSPRGRRHLNAH